MYLTFWIVTMSSADFCVSEWGGGCSVWVVWVFGVGGVGGRGEAGGTRMKRRAKYDKNITL